MQIKRLFAGGVALILAATVGMATFDTAHATSKKGKHAKSSHAVRSAPTPSATPPAVPGPPDPGVYK